MVAGSNAVQQALRAVESFGGYRTDIFRGASKLLGSCGNVRTQAEEFAQELLSFGFPASPIAAALMRVPVVLNLVRVDGLPESVGAEVAETFKRFHMLQLLPPSEVELSAEWAILLFLRRVQIETHNKVLERMVDGLMFAGENGIPFPQVLSPAKCETVEEWLSELDRFDAFALQMAWHLVELPSAGLLLAYADARSQYHMNLRTFLGGCAAQRSGGGQGLGRKVREIYNCIGSQVLFAEAAAIGDLKPAIPQGDTLTSAEMTSTASYMLSAIQILRSVERGD